MFNFQELTPKDCPLLASDAPAIVDRYNQAVRLVQEIGQEYPHLLDRDEVKKRLRKLEELQTVLTRKRYLVGFLGTTTAGKSTAFNNILDASKTDAPSSPGPGGATTAAITRVRRKDSGEHALILRYLTLEEYRTKRNKLCETVQLNPAQTDDEILTVLPQHRQDIKTGKAGSDREILPADLDSLEYFITSYKLNKDSVQETTAKRIKVPYQDRSKFLNHAAVSGGKLQPSPNFLLKDALIEFRTDKIPIQLEIIDLPGLGSQGSIDTLLTKDFLGQLQGALVFINASQINDGNVESVLARLKQFWNVRLTSRVWVVLTKFDVLREHHFFGNESGTTVFDILTTFLEGHKIPAGQVCFTSDKIYKAGSPDGQLEGITVKDPIPPKCKAHSQLSKIFLELLKDGGVAHMRDLIANVLAKEVAKETRQQVEKELTTLIDDLQHDRDMEAQRRVAKPEELLNAFDCWDRIRHVLNQWESRIDALEPIGQQLQKDLLELIEKRIPASDDILNQMSMQQLAARFEILSAALQATVDDLMNTQIIQKAYGEVGSQLADLPRVRILNDASSAEAWERFVREDSRNPQWRTDFPSFSCKVLFNEMRSLGDKNKGEYRALMREKVRTGSHQVMHALKLRVRSRLELLLTELSKLAYDGTKTAVGG